MRIMMAGAALAMALGAVALTAQAQQTGPADPPICNTNVRQYAALASGSDHGAMQRVLDATPRACRQLRAQIESRIASLQEAARSATPREASAPAPPTANNACGAARTQWAGLQTSTDRVALELMLHDTPRTCAEHGAVQNRLVQLRRLTAGRDVAGGLVFGAEFDDCDGANWCPRMIVVPQGTFSMGSPDSEAQRRSDEGPQRRITVRQFAAGKFEVTFDEWAACVSRGGCRSRQNPDDWMHGRGRRPVITVSWNDAQEYVEWLSRETGRRYRLLTEVEWEYAARAGSTTPLPWGDNGPDDANACRYANVGYWAWFQRVCNPAGGSRTLPVGERAPNRFGLYDTIGNVSEWVQDCWRENYAGLPATSVAYEADNCQSRVHRGGSWGDDPERYRVAIRQAHPATFRHMATGFRVARSIE